MEAALVEHDVIDGHFEHVRGDLLGLGHDLLRRRPHRHAADR